jgi:hypothetical protein
MKQMIIDFLDNGEIEIETKGFSGPACKTETEFLKDALGETISETLTPAFYAKDGAKVKEGRCIKPLCG